MNRLHVAVPAPRDDLVRPAFIPPGIAEKKEKAAARKRRLERDIELEEGIDYVLGILFIISFLT